MRPSGALRQRVLCLGLAIVAHLWLHSRDGPRSQIRWPMVASSRPLDVRLVAMTDRPRAIDPAPPSLAPDPRPSLRTGRPAKKPEATSAHPPRNVVSSVPVPPGQRDTPAPIDAPLALPDGSSTRRMLGILDRQQDTLARTRERLAFPVRDGYGANPLGDAIKDNARTECADALRHPSIVGLLSMAADTVRDKGCRW